MTSLSVQSSIRQLHCVQVPAAESYEAIDLFLKHSFSYKLQKQQKKNDKKGRVSDVI